MTTDSHGAMVAPPTEPTDAEVEQAEYDHGVTAIPVEVCGPVRAQQLPAKAAGYRRVTASTTQAQKVLGRDPRRRRMVLQVYDPAGATHGVFYGATAAEVTPPAPFAARLGVTLPAGGIPVASPLLELTGMDELWILADTAACELSVSAEQWAD
jgi:hypothetical protein